MRPKTHPDGTVRLTALFGPIVLATFLFNLVVILPLVAVVVLTVPDRVGGLTVGPLTLGPENPLMVILLTPLGGLLGGVENGLVVCGGLAMWRAVRRSRR